MVGSALGLSAWAGVLSCEEASGFEREAGGFALDVHGLRDDREDWDEGEEVHDRGVLLLL